MTACKVYTISCGVHILGMKNDVLLQQGLATLEVYTTFPVPAIAVIISYIFIDEFFSDIYILWLYSKLILSILNV